MSDKQVWGKRLSDLVEKVNEGEERVEDLEVSINEVVETYRKERRVKEKALPEGEEMLIEEKEEDGVS